MRIGVDIGGTTIRMGIVDGGVILKKISEPCRADKSEKETTDHLIAMLRTLVNSNIRGVGIGVPAFVDSDRGIVYNSINIPAWKEVPLKDILEQEFNLPVYINNDCNCFAFGERYHGEGTTSRNLVCISLGAGLGAGIIVDNKLYCGRNNAAGEIGCLPYRDFDFEHYCSSHFFVGHYDMTGAEAHAKALEGDAKALAIWKEFGFHLGNLIQTILFVYDPETIIIGGRISLAHDYFADSMHAVVEQFPFSEPKRNLKIRFSQNEDSSLLGAAALVL
ncbi:ROK family protein [Dysgonomonas sp. 25]|uniref:ROK family protein n=1 Tax=Dysgonomonas sp. 25 TaxID=2302933 RepID=UPI0013D7A108|nr:ROK family protein [Dysgonomonas sp. 25]NDV69865.1 ROK family protein [Dysgonomonas sp. 25]